MAKEKPYRIYVAETTDLQPNFCLTHVTDLENEVLSGKNMRFTKTSRWTSRQFKPGERVTLMQFGGSHYKVIIKEVYSITREEYDAMILAAEQNKNKHDTSLKNMLLFYGGELNTLKEQQFKLEFEQSIAITALGKPVTLQDLATKYATAQRLEKNAEKN